MWSQVWLGLFDVESGLVWVGLFRHLLRLGWFNVESGLLSVV